MYDRFLDDPSSVDAAWHEFFADFQPSQDAQARSEGAEQKSPANGQPATQTAPKQTAPATPTTSPSPKTESVAAPQTTPQGAKTKPATPKSEPPQSTPGSTGTSATARTAPPKKPSEPERKPLRGVAATIAKNMDRSEERRVGKSVDLGGRRIMKREAEQKKDGQGHERE